jgi:hypothetical protein
MWAPDPAMDKTPAALATLVGSALATASALLAIWLMSYGYATGGLRNHDPLLVAGFRTGLALSLAASIFSGVGLRRPNQMRWLGLAFALAGLLFWARTAFTGQF